MFVAILVTMFRVFVTHGPGPQLCRQAHSRVSSVYINFESYFEIICGE